ncbi:hypothetical protein VKT23_015490 [Stygiomarasmius scandens]|uniref:F-box domain-containing protein n=1 Tax=Marasmiellus scandens TaxID=2682957 RepID=A0ABR1IXX7_9AGAR
MLNSSKKTRRGLRTAKPPPSIQKLPAELLYQIFSCVLCLDVNDTLAIHTSPPWILSRVCSHWKSFMLSFPELWSSIDIRIPRNKSIPQNAQSILETWLQRAGTDTPLSITYQCSDTSDNAQELLMTCISLCKRWERASLHIPATLLPCLHEVMGKLPLLNRLHLALYNEGYSGSTRPVWLSGDFVTAFRTAPRLREVKIRQICDIANTVDLPWSQLTKYDAAEHVAGDHITLLDRMKSSVIECKLYSETSYRPPSSSSPSRFIICSKLRRLELKNCTLLERLDAPMLQHLIISDLAHPNSEAILHKFLLRSSCSLKSLDLSNTMLNQEQIMSVLNTADTIQDLRVWLGFEFASRFMRALTPGKPSGTLVPSETITNHAHRRFSMSHELNASPNDAPVTRSSSVKRLSSVSWSIRRKDRHARGPAKTVSSADPDLPLLPNLRHLRVNLVSCHRLNFAELVGMVEKRWIPKVTEGPATRSGAHHRPSGFFRRRHEISSTGMGLKSLRSLEVIATGQIATPNLVDQLQSYEAQGLELKMHLWREWK